MSDEDFELPAHMDRRTPAAASTAIVPADVRSHSNGLGRYERARTALAEANSVDEVKEIHDQAAAMQAYARQAKDTELIGYATEIRMRAEKRAGEMLAESPKAKGRAGKGRPKLGGSDPRPPKSDEPTLADLGITKTQSSKWQGLAKLPPEKFEAKVAQAKQRAEDSTTSAPRDAQSEKRRAENARIAERAAAIPAGKFGTIVVDPPWEMKKIERDVRPNQVDFDYPTMTEEELIGFGDTIKALAVDDCHLFMWATQKFLPMALRLTEQWGARYVLTMVWHKAGGFQPIGLPQYNCEFVVYARIGTPTFVDTKAFPTCFNAERREHSRKPDEFYDLIKRVTAGPRIDVFSREVREGFDQYGNEVQKFGEAAP